MLMLNKALQNDYPKLIQLETKSRRLSYMKFHIQELKGRIEGVHKESIYVLQ